MRRSQLHPELRQALRSVERDIDVSAVRALTKCGHTPESATAYLAREDFRHTRETIEKVRETLSAGFRQLVETFSGLWASMAEALEPLRAIVAEDGPEP